VVWDGCGKPAQILPFDPDDIGAPTGINNHGQIIGFASWTTHGTEGLTWTLSPDGKRSMVWDLSADFATAPQQANPNPDSYGNRRVWRYLSAGLDHHPTGYRRLTEFIPNRFAVEGLQGWQGEYVSGGALDKLPHVSINSTGSNPTSVVDWPPGTVLAHPAPDRAAAVAWRSPIKGRVSIAGGLADGGVGCGDGISWWIDRGIRTLTEGAFSDGGRQAFAEGTGGSRALVNIPVRRGQALYFVISPGPNADHCGDSTQLDVVVRQTIVKHPHRAR
jgi:hypothetical protein